jgi:hypothetical protein
MKVGTDVRLVHADPRPALGRDVGETGGSAWSMPLPFPPFSLLLVLVLLVVVLLLLLTFPPPPPAAAMVAALLAAEASGAICDAASTPITTSSPVTVARMAIRSASSSSVDACVTPTIGWLARVSGAPFGCSHVITGSRHLERCSAAVWWWRGSVVRIREIRTDSTDGWWGFWLPSNVC